MLSGEFFARQAYPDVFFQAFQFELQFAAWRDDWSGEGVLAADVADNVYEIETERARTQSGPLQLENVGPGYESAKDRRHAASLSGKVEIIIHPRSEDRSGDKHRV